MIVLDGRPHRGDVDRREERDVRGESERLQQERLTLCRRATVLRAIGVCATIITRTVIHSLST
jgi:hypothetical protein